MENNATFSGGDLFKRVKLSERVPMNKPFTINFSVCNVCNLKCEFCTYNRPNIRKEKSSLGQKGMLDKKSLFSMIDDIGSSFGNIKKVFFTGCGEPLLNRDVPDMIKYVSEKKVAEVTDIVTNGVLLNKEMSDRLISSGLSWLRVSVNGLSGEDYKKYTGVEVDFDKYVKQLRYLYENRGNTKVYIKIINYMVETEERRQKFYDIFSPICDIINVENLYFFKGTDIGESDNDKFHGRALYSDINKEPSICSLPFYFQFVDMDGSVYPCCERLPEGKSASIGNVREQSFYEIWNSHMKNFQRKMLDGKESVDYCYGCGSSLAWARPEDVLDDNVEEIKQRYEDILKKD